MRTLGMDTSGPFCTVGTAGDAGLIAELTVHAGRNLAEKLPDLVNRVLSDSGIRGQDLDGIAVSIGPGSFTGLRIGLGFAKGLAFGWDRPLLAVPTMDGLMRRVPSVFSRAAVAIPSRKTEVYLGLFRPGESGWTIEGEIKVRENDRITSGLPPGDIAMLGEGMSVLRRKDGLHSRFHLMPVESSIPSGVLIAEMGIELLKRGVIADAHGLAPMYIKRFKGIL
ncbi:tRNA (adenosine(37)-N6)-threonylcarbamoyltransferase complex dimerization subunit type 1 TsaB [bacterium]|nr:tRNA (adenosine(37)-N6)-threonylcarbamoyltransferase complex dimerization subunit type 1 TsaB [bacterium]